MPRAGLLLSGLLVLLSIPGCVAPPLDREENDRLIARCYAKARPEKYQARGGETVAAVVESYYDYLAAFLVSDALGEIARANKFEPRSVLNKDDVLNLPAPGKLLRPDLRIARVAPREVGLILDAWDKFRVHECGLVDIVMGHEQKGGGKKIDLPLPDRFVKISATGERLLQDAVKGLEKKRVKGNGPAKALGQLRSIGFAAGGKSEFHYDEYSLKLSKELDTGLQRFSYALRYAEEWAQAKQ